MPLDPNSASYSTQKIIDDGAGYLAPKLRPFLAQKLGPKTIHKIRKRVLDWASSNLDDRLPTNEINDIVSGIINVFVANVDKRDKDVKACVSQRHSLAAIERENKTKKEKEKSNKEQNEEPQTEQDIVAEIGDKKIDIPKQE